MSYVLDADNRFNLTAYEEYSPLYLPATYAMTYTLAFAMSTCVLVHTILYHGRSLLNGIKKIRVGQDDIHAKLMRNYPEVPDWWYAICFLGFFFLMVVVVEVSALPFHMPVKTFCLSAVCRYGIHRCLYGPCCCLWRCRLYMSCRLGSFTP